MITIRMAPGGASDFNSDLTNLQGQAGQAQNQANQQEAAQQQANSVASDAQAVSNDLSTLQSAEQDATGTGSVAGDLAQMRRDLGQTQTDLQHVLGEAGHTDVDTLCSDADTVSSDYDTVSGDYDTISGDQDSSDGDTGDISTAIKALQHDQQALDADRTSDPADVPANAHRCADQPVDQGRAGAEQRGERHHRQRHLASQSDAQRRQRGQQQGARGVLGGRRRLATPAPDHVAGARRRRLESARSRSSYAYSVVNEQQRHRRRPRITRALVGSRTWVRPQKSALGGTGVHRLLLSVPAAVWRE